MTEIDATVHLPSVCVPRVCYSSAYVFAVAVLFGPQAGTPCHRHFL